MNFKLRRTLLSFAVQLAIYGGLTVLYLFGVLNFLNDWIFQIEAKNLQLYAVLSLLLIVAQGLVLEALTAGLLNLIHPKLKD
jgi:hypothetical protein